MYKYKLRSLLCLCLYAAVCSSYYYASIKHKVGIISTGGIAVCAWRLFGVSTGGVGVCQIPKNYSAIVRWDIWQNMPTPTTKLNSSLFATCHCDTHQAKLPHPLRNFAFLYSFMQLINCDSWTRMNNNLPRHCTVVTCHRSFFFSMPVLWVRAVVVEVPEWLLGAQRGNMR